MSPTDRVTSPESLDPLSMSYSSSPPIPSASSPLPPFCATLPAQAQAPPEAPHRAAKNQTLLQTNTWPSHTTTPSCQTHLLQTHTANTTTRANCMAQDGHTEDQTFLSLLANTSPPANAYPTVQATSLDPQTSPIPTHYHSTAYIFPVTDPADPTALAVQQHPPSHQTDNLNLLQEIGQINDMACAQGPPQANFMGSRQISSETPLSRNSHHLSALPSAFSPTSPLTSATPRYDPEKGLTSRAELLHTQIRHVAICTNCQPNIATPGTINKDCAGSKRRFKCLACKKTWSVVQFLKTFGQYNNTTVDTHIQPTPPNQNMSSRIQNISHERQHIQILSPQTSNHTAANQHAIFPPQAIHHTNHPNTSNTHLSLQSQIPPAPNLCQTTDVDGQELEIAQVPPVAEQQLGSPVAERHMEYITPGSHQEAFANDKLMQLLSSPAFSSLPKESQDAVIRGLATWPESSAAADINGGQTHTRTAHVSLPPFNVGQVGSPLMVTCPNNSPLANIGAMKKRMETIDATLDGLGLKGKNRKKRRQALMVLMPLPVPSPQDIIRICLECGKVDLAGGIKAVNSLGLDPRMILYILKIRNGVEILVASWHEDALRTKASQNGLHIGKAVDDIPTSREFCNELLKAITPGASSPSTPLPVKEYLEQWILRIKCNMPSRVQKGASPHIILDTTNPFGSSPYETMASYGGSSSNATPLANTTIGQKNLQPDDMDTESTQSINDSSLWIEPYQPDLIKPATGCPSREHLTVHNKKLQIMYLNSRGLGHEKLIMLCSQLKSNTFMFVAETWHQSDERLRAHPNVLAISPEPHRSPLSRGKGGLLIMAHSNIKHLVKSIATREHSITATINGLRVCGIYLPPSMDAKFLWSTLSQIPAKVDIVLGDVNATLGKFTSKSHRERCDVLSKWASTMGLSLKSPDSKIRSSEIDHVLARPSIICQNYIVSKAPYDTDHPLLSIDVIIQTKRDTKHSIRYNIHKLESEPICKRFFELVEQKAQALMAKFSNPCPIPLPKINDLDKDLLFLLQSSLEETVGTYIPSGLYTCGSHPKPICRDTSAAIRVVRLAQRESNAKCELCAKDPSLSPEEEAVRYFTAVYKQTTCYAPEKWLPSSPQSPNLETIDSVCEAIKGYPSNKSPGIDGIDRRVLLVLTKAPIFIKILTSLYNHCINGRYTPHRWNKSVTSPIPKGGKDPRFICNRRPISLTVLFRRIFEKLILNRITSSLQLNCGQGGFRNGFSCITQVLLTEQARANGQNIRVFLDLKCAYDSVPTDKMLAKLSKKGVDDYLVSLVESLLSDCSTVIAVNGCLTEPVLLEKGLFQGSLLSPILFDVFIDDLASSINGMGSPNKVPECLLFADDILLQCSHPARMHVLLQLVEEWCLSNGMTINVPKSGTIYMSHPLFLNNIPIPVCDTYKYLGIPLGLSGIQPQALIAENIRKATAALVLVKSSLVSRSWPPSTKINVYKTYIRSVFEYAAPLLILLQDMNHFPREISKGIKAMQIIQNDAIKWIFYKKHPILTLESLAGLASVRFRFEELTSRLRLHLDAIPEINPLYHWLKSPLNCALVNRAYCYFVPKEYTIESIYAYYKQCSFESAADKNITAKYLASHARLSTGMDASLCIQNSKTRKLAIRWRCNSFGLHKTCATCNRSFNRGHTRCLKLKLSRAIMADYTEALASDTFGNKYNILDHLLNTKMFSLFGKAATGMLSNESRGSGPTGI
jgi:hypothetical protein